MKKTDRNSAIPGNYDRINSICLIILAAVAIAVTLIYTRAILVPFVIAFFVFAIMSPAIDWFREKIRLPRICAITLTVCLFLVVFSILFLFVGYSLYGFLESADTYSARIVQFFGEIQKAAASFNIRIDSALLQETIRDIPVFSMAKNITTAVMAFLGNTVLVMIFVLFFLIGESVDSHPNKLVREIRRYISRYATIKSIISVITGGIIFVILALCDIELAFLFGLLTALLNFIPNVGSIIATVLPIPVIILQYGFGWRLAVAFVAILAVQFIIGNIIETRLMGESMGLHPVTVLLCLMFWGLVWGVPGMFLAVPITAIVKIILSRIETTKPIADILEGNF